MSADPFRPWFWLRNPHAQTILGVVWKGSAFPHATIRRRVRLPDGDRLVMHDTTPPGWRAGDPVAILVHGLSGCHRSGGIVRLARLLLARGIRTARLDLRGTGAGFALARGCYNAGCSADVRAALAVVHLLAPDSPLWLAGISLGGNVVLKLAGEAEEQRVPNLARVAAIAPPVDLEACLRLLTHPRNRVYERHFVRDLIAEARRRAKLYPDPPLPVFPRRTSLRTFDDLYTAPRAGFRDAAEYYARSSSAQFVPRIRVPALILAARDDPFVAAGPIEQLACPPQVEVRLTDHGGHGGFLGWDGAGGFCWGERAVAAWLLAEHGNGRVEKATAQR
jgi:predicted alpha/beta-fold hydrolase